METSSGIRAPRLINKVIVSGARQNFELPAAQARLKLFDKQTSALSRRKRGSAQETKFSLLYPHRDAPSTCGQTFASGGASVMLIFVRELRGSHGQLVNSSNQTTWRERLDPATLNLNAGWEAGTRTPIRRSRVCSLTIRRPPNEGPIASIPTGSSAIPMKHSVPETMLPPGFNAGIIRFVWDGRSIANGRARRLCKMRRAPWMAGPSNTCLFRGLRFC